MRDGLPVTLPLFPSAGFTTLMCRQSRSVRAAASLPLATTSLNGLSLGAAAGFFVENGE